MMMAESTIAPIAIAMPPSDMMLLVRPSFSMGRKERMIAIGRVTIATKAERRCQRKTTQTNATTMLSSISFHCRVEMEFLISVLRS